jgi:hypothetical protein
MAETTQERPRRMHWRNQDLLDALKEAGIIRDGDYVRRVVIDVCVGSAVVVHVERYGDDRLLRVIRGMTGVDVHCDTRAENE